MTIPSKQGRLAIVSLGIATVLAGCGETKTSTSSFSGEQHAVATRIASFQKHVSEGSQKKICGEDLASALVTSIGKSANGKSCPEVLKEQLKDVEDPSLTIKSIRVNGKNAVATVKTTHLGKTRPSTLTLVKEGEDWRISGV
jgi:hypothetical protein